MRPGLLRYLIGQVAVKEAHDWRWTLAALQARSYPTDKAVTG